jgi:hypothetical protein
MRCKECDYSLWNVRGRTCPECGAAFNPADHVFAPNMVQFCCIQCDQQYYGTDSNGLIVPREFACVKCGQHCSLSGDMLLRPAPGATEASIELEELPWTQQHSLGRIRAWWKTVWLCLGRPSTVGTAIARPRSSGAGAWLFALCVPLVASALLTVLVFYGIGAVSTSGSRYGGLRGSMLVEGAASMAFSLACIVAGMWLVTAVAAAISWLVLIWDGNGPKYSRVFACWAFGATPILLAAIPCVGPYCMSPVILVWTCVLAGIMMDRCKLARTGIVVLAAIAPPVMAFFAVAATVMVLVASVTAAMPGGTGGTMGGSGATPGAQVDSDDGGGPDPAMDGEPDAGADVEPASEPSP